MIYFERRMRVVRINLISRRRGANRGGQREKKDYAKGVRVRPMGVCGT